MARRFLLLLVIMLCSLLAAGVVNSFPAGLFARPVAPLSSGFSPINGRAAPSFSPPSSSPPALVVMPSGLLTVTVRPEVQAMIDQVVSSTVRQYDGDLSGEWPVMVAGESYTLASRYTYSGEPISLATRYAGQHLSDLGMSLEYHQWDTGDNPNVIGELAGQECPEEIFIVSAHLDSRARTPETSMVLAPGADDNASGSTAVLVAADILSQFQWGPTFRFALFTGEEQGLLGSQAYAGRAISSGENIRGVINLDMIGWNTPGSSPVMELHTKSSVPGSAGLAQLFAGVIDAYVLALSAEIIVDGTGASDHRSFWDQGYNAILVIEDTWYSGTSDFNPYYHTVNDRLMTLDIGYFTEMVRAAVATMAHAGECATSGQLSGQVIVQGRPSNAGAEVCAVDGEVVAQCGLTDSQGYFSLTMAGGTYDVTAEMGRYLDARRAAVPVANGDFLALPPVTLLGGDAVEDDEIDIRDLAFMGARYGLQCGDPGWDEQADVNDDCTLDILDITITGGNYRAMSPVPWP